MARVVKRISDTMRLNVIEMDLNKQRIKFVARNNTCGWMVGKSIYLSIRDAADELIFMDGNIIIKP